MDGYNGTTEKPSFEKISGFFKKYPQRQPCPYNIIFHDVFIKACDKIINNHFYKSTGTGSAHANFNRHVGSHILNDEDFATKENCIRLFILIDTMTEIYINEARQYDPRFDLGSEETHNEIKLFADIILSSTEKTPEKILLDTDYAT